MPAVKLVRFICIVCGKEFEALCNAGRGGRLPKCPVCGGNVRHSRAYTPDRGTTKAERARIATKGNKSKKLHGSKRRKSITAGGSI